MALKKPPLKDAALPSLGLALASWLASRCAWLSPAVQQAEAPLHQGDSAVAVPALAPLPSRLYLAATALVVLALLLLSHMRRRSVGDRGGGAAAARAGSIPGCCRCGRCGGSCDGGTLGCGALGAERRGPQGWAWSWRPRHCGACGLPGVRLQEGNTTGDAAVAIQRRWECGGWESPPLPRTRPSCLAAAATEATEAAAGGRADLSPSASLGTGARGLAAEQPMGDMEPLGPGASCTAAEKQPAPPKRPRQPRAQPPHRQPGPQRACGEGRGHGLVGPSPPPRCSSARGFRGGAECGDSGSACAVASVSRGYAARCNSFDAGAGGSGERCGNGAVAASRGSETAAAELSQRYVARTRLTSTRIKIHGGGAQPEQVAPGYQQRIAAVVAAAGQQLEGAYVRRGCIELIVDSYCSSTEPQGAPQHGPDSGAPSVATALGQGQGGDGGRRPELVAPGELVRALDLPPSDSVDRAHAASVWKHPPAPGNVLLAPGPAAADADTPRSSGTGAQHQGVHMQPPAAEVPVGDGAAATGRGSRQVGVLLEVRPWVLSIAAAAFTSAAGAPAHAGASARSNAGGGDGRGGPALAVLSVRVWSPYGAVPEVTVRFGGRFLRARVELTAVDLAEAAVPGPRVGARGVGATMMTPRGCYFVGTVEILDPPGDRRRCGDGGGDSRTAGLLLLQAHVPTVPTVPKNTSDAALQQEMQRSTRVVQLQATQGCTASRPVPVLCVDDPRVAEELLASAAGGADPDPGAGDGLSPDEAEGLVVDLGIFLSGLQDARAAAGEGRGGLGFDGGGNCSRRRASSGSSRAVAGLRAGPAATAGAMMAGEGAGEGHTAEVGTAAATTAAISTTAAAASATAGAVCRGSLLHLYILGKHLLEWVLANAAADDDGSDGGSGAAVWSATLERLRSDLAVVTRLLEASTEGGGAAGAGALGRQQGEEDGEAAEEEGDGWEAEKDEGPVVVACVATQGEAARAKMAATRGCAGGMPAAVGPGLATTAAADVADCDVKAGREVAAAVVATGVGRDGAGPSRPVPLAWVFAASGGDAGSNGGEGTSPGLWSMLCWIPRAYGSLYDAGYQAYLVDYCASTAHVVDAMGFLSVGGILMRTWQEEPAWRHRPPAAFLAHIAPPLVTLMTSLVTTTAWWLLPRPAWARLVRSAQGPRYLSFVLGLLLMARPGAEAPPAIAAYHARAGSVVMGEAVVLSATLVVMPATALLLAVLRLPAHVLVWRKLGAYGGTLSAAAALALALAVVFVLVNLVLHVCLLAQYRRRSRVAQRRQVRAKAE